MHNGAALGIESSAELERCVRVVAVLEDVCKFKQSMDALCIFFTLLATAEACASAIRRSGSKSTDARFTFIAPIERWTI